MTEEIVKNDVVSEEAITKLLQMDVNLLTVPQRNQYLYWLAKRSGLDPALKPFDLIPSKDKTRLILYANAGCADQLREINNIQSEVLYEGALKLTETEYNLGVYVVRVRVWTENAEGKRLREYTDIGSASIEGLKGEAVSDAVMKAHTRAERRTTLGFKGLGIPDISELDGITNSGPKTINPQASTRSKAVVVEGEVVNMATGEIITPPKTEEKTVTNGVYKKIPPAVPPVSL